MAELQDLDVSAVSELDAVEEQIEQKTAAEPKQPDVPEKYRGKSVEEIVRMHQEAEKVISRQGQEVGEVRRLADELLKSQLQRKPEPEKPKEIDFFENPQEAIRQAVENNPKVLAAEQYAIQVQREQAKQKLAQMHPDFSQIVQDSEFADWIKSSKVRMKLFQEAEAYDVDSADELLSTFKQLKVAKQKPVSDAEKKARTEAMQAAAVDTGGSGESSRKVYRRADLIRLKMRDPSRYESMQDEISAAYREGRIK